MWTGDEDSQFAVEDVWPARPESCTLTFFVNLLQLSDEYKSHDEFKLSLHCGSSCVDTKGTLEKLNEAKLGNAVRVPGDDCVEKILQFLNDNSIEVKLLKQGCLFGSSVMKLRDTKVAQLVSNRGQGKPIEVAFALHGPNTAAPVGTVRMILEVSVNEVSPPATGKAAITCDKCSGLRSPDDGAFQYELIDGILHEKTISSTEQEIRRIQQKVRTLTMDELIEQRDSFSPDGPDGPDGPSGRCCNRCGGLTITGTTCETVETDGVKGPSGFGDSRHNTDAKTQLCNPGTNKLRHGISRNCERCNACLSWLPDYCRCPKCGHKKLEEKSVPQEGRTRGQWSGPEPANLPDDRVSSSSRSGSTLVASSHSCPMCHLRQGRCTDCAKQARSASSDSGRQHYSRCKRPQTRYRNRTRTGHRGIPNDARSGKNERLEQLRKAYLEPAPGTKCSASKSLAHVGEEIGTKRPTTTQIRHSYRSFLRKVRQQNRNRYSYRFGKRPPGMVAGHQSCMKQEELVPPHMGWRWNICTPGIGKVRPGWRPGAVRKPIMQLMQHFLKCYPLDIVPVSSRKGGKLCCPGHPAGSCDQCPKDTQKPMLQIAKKHGEYCITMNPLKDSETLKTAKDPFLPCKPIKFKLSKDPHLTKLYKLRESLKQKSMTLCGCKDLECCEHLTKREKQLLVAEIRRMTKVLGLSPETTIADVPSGSESDNDVEFTPQSAMVREDLPKPDVVIAETQYCEGDYSVPAGKYPYGRKLTKVPVAGKRTLVKCPAAPATKTTDRPGTSKGRATPTEGSSKAKPGTQGKTQAKAKADVPTAKASPAGKPASGTNQPTAKGAATQRKSTVSSEKSSGKNVATPVPKVTTQPGKSSKNGSLPRLTPTAGGQHRGPERLGTVGEGTGGRTDQSATKRQHTGHRHCPDVHVHQRCTLSMRPECSGLLVACPRPPAEAAQSILCICHPQPSTDCCCYCHCPCPRGHCSSHRWLP